eukprot:scaffold952_cov249-Pinguiococcus_pyrenoidosus.AAC.26
MLCGEVQPLRDFRAAWVQFCCVLDRIFGARRTRRRSLSDATLPCSFLRRSLALLPTLVLALQHAEELLFFPLTSRQGFVHFG